MLNSSQVVDRTFEDPVTDNYNGRREIDGWILVVYSTVHRVQSSVTMILCTYPLIAQMAGPLVSDDFWLWLWVNTPAALHCGVSGWRGGGGGERLADLVDQLTLECCHSFRFYGSCRKRIQIRDSSMPKRILFQCGVSSDVFISLIVPTTCSSICWD